MTGGALQAAIAQPPAPGMTAGRAGEPAWPAQPLQVVQAVLIGAEPRLELARRPRVVNPSPRLLHARILLRLTEYPESVLSRIRLNTDRGVQYTSIRYAERLAEEKAVRSVGSKGDRKSVV